MLVKTKNRLAGARNNSINLDSKRIKEVNEFFLVV